MIGRRFLDLDQMRDGHEAPSQLRTELMDIGDVRAWDASPR
jgi:hypothetical protein